MSDDQRANQYHLSRATKRLNRDLKLLLSDPIPDIDVAPNEDDILDWHFVIHGKKDTLYENGVYHGELVFPPTFPFNPPKILFLTPNGRFRVNYRICFSLSDFHPEEWKPAYTVTAVLRGIYDFMHENTETIGSIEASESEKRQLAADSDKYNLTNATFCKLFPQFRVTTDSPCQSVDDRIIHKHVITDQPCRKITAGYQVNTTVEVSPKHLSISNSIPSHLLFRKFCCFK